MRWMSNSTPRVPMYKDTPRLVGVAPQGRQSDALGPQGGQISDLRPMSWSSVPISANTPDDIQILQNAIEIWGRLSIEGWLLSNDSNGTC